MRIIKRRKINVKNCYLLFVSLLAFISLMGNFYQDHFYNRALSMQDEMIEHIDSNTVISDNTR